MDHQEIGWEHVNWFHFVVELSPTYGSSEHSNENWGFTKTGVFLLKQVTACDTLTPLLYEGRLFN